MIMTQIDNYLYRAVQKTNLLEKKIIKSRLSMLTYFYLTMGKDGSRFVHKEIFQRVNFLHQAAQMILKQDDRNIELCRYYISTMRTVAEKHVIRIHPSIKRTYCKKCNIILLSGKTCRIRSRSKSEKHTVVTCLLCGSIKRYMWRKNYSLWLDKPEAWLPDKK